MLRTSESESEILLGNKQLLGIFFVVALLLAVAFYGGFMVGRSGSAKKTAAADEAAANLSANPAAAGTAGETHVVSAGAGTSDNGAAAPDGSGSQELQPVAHSRAGKTSAETPGNHLANSRNRPLETEPSDTSPNDTFAPQVGEQFLQVAAVSRDEAEAVADVLHKKGFRAHAVPKPGNPKLYRVIIGPIRDTGELSSTREALVRTGFREVILQRY